MRNSASAAKRALVHEGSGRVDRFKYQLAFHDRHFDLPSRNKPGFSEPLALKADARFFAAVSGPETYFHEADGRKFIFGFVFAAR